MFVTELEKNPSNQIKVGKMSRRISYNTPNPQRYFSWGKTCPECNSKDIRMRENPNHPMWKCRNCGAEFDSSKSDNLRSEDN